MYMEYIKVFAKNEKEQKTWIQIMRIYSQCIGMEFGIEKCSMQKNEKQEKRNNGRNRTAKSEKYQNPRKEGKLQVFENIRSEHHQTSGDEGKIRKVPEKNKKTSQNQALQYKTHQR